MIENLQPKTGPILSVEDSADDFEAISRAFKKAGLTNVIEHVSSGEEALNYLHSKEKLRPSLILLDLNMPGIGGRKFLEIAKQDKEYHKTPIIVLTTSGYEPDVKMCYELGANSYIVKPVDFDMLTSAIKHLKEYWIDTTILP